MQFLSPMNRGSVLASENMTEERAPYSVPGDNPGKTAHWVDLRFADRRHTHTGVRVLRGTTIIEVQRDGNKDLFDIAECKLIDRYAIIVE